MSSNCDKQRLVESTHLRLPDAHHLGKRLKPAVVAIDGPAASGKSTIGQMLAESLAYLFFDTGAMYRAVTWAALQRGLDVHDSGVMGDLAKTLDVDVVPSENGEESAVPYSVLVDGQDVTIPIRSAEVDQSVSPVSAHEAVRRNLSNQQRHLAHTYGTGQRDKAGIVMAGRDIGTVVVPDAPVKVYLDATPEERARRRYEEQRDRGVSVQYQDVLAGILRRDEIDSNRELAPLQIAEDAEWIDTTALTRSQVVERIIDLIRRAVEGG